MNSITAVTRRAIIDYLSVGIHWSGKLEEYEFLSRIYDLTQIPSDDIRFKTALGDIRQHRVNWNDWPDEWVFTDQRFNILWASDDEFLKFLCETVHPVVRPDKEIAEEMVREYNVHLRNDGWEFFEKANISGRPVFGARKIGERIAVFEEPTGWEKVDRQIQEVRLRLDTAENEEQFQAIGLISREALISLAETVYDPKKHPSTDGVTPSKTDATRRLEAFFGIELQGGANEEARSHAKGALKFAAAVQHKRTADFRTAALCAEATASVINIVAIICGRRG